MLIHWIMDGDFPAEIFFNVSSYSVSTWRKISLPLSGCNGLALLSAYCITGDGSALNY